MGEKESKSAGMRGSLIEQVAFSLEVSGCVGLNPATQESGGIPQCEDTVVSVNSSSNAGPGTPARIHARYLSQGRAVAALTYKTNFLNPSS